MTNREMDLAEIRATPEEEAGRGMKRREMSDEEINRAIAEKLEPSDSLIPAMEAYWSSGGCGGNSPLNAWMCALNLPVIAEPTWKPRDFVSDPAMTVRLLKCGDISLLSERRGWRAYRADFRIDGPRTHRGDWPINERLGRAVAEAFCRAHNLDAESEPIE